MEQHRAAYREEAYELLAELESSLLDLEEAPTDLELIGRIFRALHTLKGSGAMFGFDNIANFTHEIETVYDFIRDGKLTVDKKLIDITLSACDLIKKMVANDPVDPIHVAEIKASYTQMIPTDDEDEIPADGERDQTKPLRTFRIHFNPSPSIFKTGTNPIFLLKELSETGICTIRGNTENIPTLDELDPETCYMKWDISLTADLDENDIRDVFIFVEDHCELSIESGKAVPNMENTTAVSGEENTVPPISDAPENLEPEAVTAENDSNARVFNGHVGKGAGDTTIKNSSGAEVRSNGPTPTISSIRVSAVKLDKLVDLVGELVTVQARLGSKAESLQDPDILLISEEVERLTAELRDNTMQIRMQPVGVIFGTFKRLVRDLARELGKEVALITEGEETELDKTVIEKLYDPLVHLIRNTVDHGIEPPQVRSAKGKPTQGVVRLFGEHLGPNVIIHISDDGAGLDVEAIRKKAADRKLIHLDDDLTEGEIYSLLFAPGFSTAKEISGISGRGVGLDVVKRTIESLGGTVRITSVPNEGTAITLKLPLTLAIIDGLLVKIADELFILPLSAIEECVELTDKRLAEAKKKNYIHFRDELVPYIDLSKVFSIDGRRSDIEQVVITQSKGFRIGLGVDYVIGHHHTVIKTLGKMYKNAQGISGATILGDGSIALIIDVIQLLENNLPEIKA